MTPCRTWMAGAIGMAFAACAGRAPGDHATHDTDAASVTDTDDAPGDADIDAAGHDSDAGVVSTRPSPPDPDSDVQSPIGPPAAWRHPLPVSGAPTVAGSIVLDATGGVAYVA